ncbi:MAG: ChbG/HpnK family deacetylase [Negativicutes bacterium]|nr:ChbG/HpnK family deacetylase [Negativicutes bacterium]
MKRLIVNADDFGLHPAVNRAIIAGHASGCITSTSLMTGGAAFHEALAMAGDCLGLGIGVHLTLVGERPLTDPALIPSLVDREGRFPDNYVQFMVRFLQGKINLTEVRRELAAQLDKVVAGGITITHVDSHQHLHVLPGIIDIVLDLAGRNGVKALRIPDESLFFTGGYPFTIGRVVGRSGLSFLAAVARRKAKKRGFAVPDFFFGMLAGGNMREEYLLNIINTLPQGTSEIMMHPGNDDALLNSSYPWVYHWQNELAAVTSSQVLEQLVTQEIQLVSFRELEHG